MTNTRRRVAASYIAGVLCANSLPHLATAVSGHSHLTPLAGASSNRWVNLAWGGANLVAGLVLISRQRTRGRWDVRLVAFDAGAATFATWMAASERFMKLNWTS
jgi:hypothetical protein